MAADVFGEIISIVKWCAWKRIISSCSSRTISSAILRLNKLKMWTFVRCSFDGEEAPYIAQHENVLRVWVRPLLSSSSPLSLPPRLGLFLSSIEKVTIMIYCALHSRVLFPNFRGFFSCFYSYLPCRALAARAGNPIIALCAPSTPLLSFHPNLTTVDVLYGERENRIFWHAMLDRTMRCGDVYVCAFECSSVCARLSNTKIMENFDLWIILVKEQCR